MFSKELLYAVCTKVLLYSAIGVAFVLATTGCGPNDQYFRDRTLLLTGPLGSCSGEQVRAPSGKDYVLTAGHCAGLAVDGHIKAKTEAGKTFNLKVIHESGTSDLLLLEGIPGLKGLEIAQHMSRHVRTFTHGRGMATYKTEGEFIQLQMVDITIGEVLDQDGADACLKAPKYKIIHASTPFGMLEACGLHLTESITTAMTVPGSSGGMMVDDMGKLIGVVSAGDGTFSLFATLSDVQAFLKAR